jgi:hypothetical protein
MELGHWVGKYYRLVLTKTEKGTGQLGWEKLKTGFNENLDNRVLNRVLTLDNWKLTPRTFTLGRLLRSSQWEFSTSKKAQAKVERTLSR